MPQAWKAVQLAGARRTHQNALLDKRRAPRVHCREVLGVPLVAPQAKALVGRLRKRGSGLSYTHIVGLPAHVLACCVFGESGQAITHPLRSAASAATRWITTLVVAQMVGRRPARPAAARRRGCCRALYTTSNAPPSSPPLSYTLPPTCTAEPGWLSLSGLNGKLLVRFY